MPTSSLLLSFRSGFSSRGLPRAVPRLVVVALLVAASSVVTATTSAASTPGCGEVITVDTTLTHDLLDCPNIGLVIGADGITLNLHGHTIDGDGTPVSFCPAGRRCDVGVDNSAGHRDVTVEDGAIQQFTVGFFSQGAANEHVHGLTIRHTDGAGVFVPGSTGVTVDDNTITDPGVVAVSMFDSSNALVSQNAASGSSGYALFLQADHSVIEHNRLTSDTHGIAAVGTDDLVRSNLSDNGGSIDVLDSSSGIRILDNDLRDVGDGVTVGVAAGTLVQHNVVSATGANDGGGFGVILDGSTGSTVDANVIRVSGPGPGIYVARLDAPTAPRENRVTRNVATSRHADGILVDPDATATLLAGNVAANSGHDGLDVQAPGTTVTSNAATHNANLGIEAVPGVVDGGGNVAAANGNPAQCTNISCR
jgi:parallel beta-helix repeat protein